MVKSLLKSNGKSTIVLTLLLFFFTSVNAQKYNWTFLKGYAGAPIYSAFGTKGVANNFATPNGRYGVATWELNGKFYFFGGEGYPVPLIIGFSGFPVSTNDLWCYDPATKQWTWLSGLDNTYTAQGIYGTIRVENENNMPGSRSGAVTWTLNGKLYLFGGTGLGASSSSGSLNDLWSYDPATNKWTWIKGANTVNQLGTYGTRGNAAAANTPGARQYALGGVIDGKLYLFGGEGYGASGSSSGSLNDLWSYDPVTGNWSWLKGANAINQTATYGSIGQGANANTPGARKQSVAWIDNGKFYLFGGNGYNASAAGKLNDLWSYDPSTGFWTWVKGPSGINQAGVYGVKQVAANNNVPGARVGAVGWALDHKLYLFGGSATGGAVNDIWSFDIGTGLWTWLGGPDTPDGKGNYGVKGQAHPEAVPGARNVASSLVYNNKLYLLHGQGYGKIRIGFLNDIWSFSPATTQWTWEDGSDYFEPVGNYGTSEIPAASNNPGGRIKPLSWENNGKLYLFGGQGYGIVKSNNNAGALNDLWRYDSDTNEWVWLKGSNDTHQAGTYGTINIPADANTPGARLGAVGWLLNGKYYLFGGSGYGATSSVGRLNDLWSYDLATNRWTWIKGPNTVNQVGTYGTINVAHANNLPGPRNDGVGWVHGGKLYLFGGEGLAANSTFGRLNDLWCFDPATGNWTWIKGSNVVNPVNVHGTKQVENSANTPGGRVYGTSWIDQDKLYIFGGMSITSGSSIASYNDLWAFDVNTRNWTWLNGSNTANAGGVYSGPNAVPGSVYGASGITVKGKFYLFGGQNANTNAYLSELWVYQPNTNEWVFIKGESGKTSTYEAIGVAAVNNAISGRINAATWVQNDHLYVFGGRGMGVDRADEMRADLWRFSLPSSNAKLANIELNNGQISPNFDQDLKVYAAVVGNSVGNIKVKPTSASGTAQIKVNHVDVADGSESGEIALNVGENIITIEVVAEDGQSTDSYTLNVNREEVLPVKVSSFTAKAAHHLAEIKWTTISEQNNQEFILSRSVDGKTFSELGKVKGAGNSSTPKSYFYYDRKPLNGANYYQLEQMDADGKINLVGTAVVNFKFAATTISVYPNPTGKEINLMLPNQLNTTLAVTIVTMLGNVVHTERLPVVPGQTQYKLNNKELPAGQYVLQLSNAEIRESFKVLVN